MNAIKKEHISPLSTKGAKVCIIVQKFAMNEISVTRLSMDITPQNKTGIAELNSIVGTKRDMCSLVRILP